MNNDLLNCPSLIIKHTKKKKVIHVSNLEKVLIDIFPKVTSDKNIH
jgi:hypothetical protein